MRSERGALLLSALAAGVLAVVGVAAALATGSGAILLDGLFNLCFAIAGGLTLRVASLLARPDDADYPFGYLFFEPLINTAKGLLILGVSAFALVDAAVALATGGRAVEFGPAAFYAAVATVACGAVVWALRRSAPSPLVRADVETWTVNAAVSGGVLLGFLLAAWLVRSGHAGAAAYVDPAMVALVVLLTLAVPVRMAVTGLLALLNRAAAAPLVAGMEAEVRAALGPLPVRRIWVRAIQPGRTTYAVVHVLVPPGTALDLAEADRLRGAVIGALVARHAPVLVDVLFTAVEVYAEPSTVSAAPPPA
jgi:predicted Co/Zn/Cd cation transporter (cation efflux family)